MYREQTRALNRLDPISSRVLKPVPNITFYHHFKFSRANAGVVTAKVYATSEEDVNILKKGVTVSSLRGHRPTGIDPARQWYLYE